MPSLFVIRGNDQGSRFELQHDVVGLGRDSSNVVQLHDTEVSRQHAEVRRNGGVFTLTDLDSSNGTYVNGRRIRRHVLASGDQVQVGGTLMLFTGPSEDIEYDLTGKVDISSALATEEQSRIIRSVTHEEGSRIFDLDADAPQNTWLGAGSQQSPGDVSHGPGRQPHARHRPALAADYGVDLRVGRSRPGLHHARRRRQQATGPQGPPHAQRVRADEKITISKTILDYVRERNEGVLTSDARQDDRWNPAASIVRAGVREAICVPMQGRYDVVGVIYIDTSTSPQDMILKGGATKFGEDHLKLMIAIAHQAALAVEDTRYYSAMVQAERLAAIGQTVATLSHHIKNILQGIRGGSYLIEMGLSEHDESLVQKGWKIVEKNQNKISTLVLDMLTFSKEREPDLSPSNMNQVVSDVVELMQSRAKDLEIQLVWEPAQEMPTLVFDPEGIHRAVLNIVTNAIDAAAETEQAGQVRVTTEYAAVESKLRVCVDDNGPGIPAEHMDQLFSPFVSFKGSHGTGLGLPVSQKIVNEHGGRIQVESTVGQGSRFIVEIPAVLPGATSATRAV